MFTIITALDALWQKTEKHSRRSDRGVIYEAGVEWTVKQAEGNFLMDSV